MNTTKGVTDESRDLSTLVAKAKDCEVWGDVEEKMFQDKTWHATLTNHLEEKLASKAKNAELVTQLRKRSLAALASDNRRLRNRTDSAPHVAGLKHQRAKLQRVAYNFESDINVPLDAAYRPPNNFSVNSEVDVQFFVSSILETICGELSEHVTIACNRRICGIECDILLLHGENHIPFAAAEIKKNGTPEYVRAIFVDDHKVPKKFKGKVQGENLNQLRQISLFGLQKVFGLISDGNHSMITCTHEFSIAHDLENKAVSSRQEENGQYHPDSSPGNKIEFVENSSNLMTQVFNRLSGSENILYCSGYSNVENDMKPGAGCWMPTLKLLTHFVRLALNTVDPRCFCREVKLNTRLPVRVIDPNDHSDMFAHTTITFNKVPNLWKCLLGVQQLPRIHLFKHLGMGANGDCCLAATNSKNPSFCAVKFFAERHTALECAQKEEFCWHAIYETLPKARVVPLPPTSNQDKIQEDACLCMPYLVPIDDHEERKKALTDGSVKGCLQDFAAKGYHHNEVRWRHLGRFRLKHDDPSSTKVYLCDLGNLRKRDTESDCEWGQATSCWIQESTSKLEESAM